MIGTQRQIKAFVFDLDMTLIDSSYAIHKCMNMLAEHFGLRRVSRDEVMVSIGLLIEDAWKSFWGKYNDEWLTYYRKNLISEENKGLRPFENTISTLNALQNNGYLTAVVTNRTYPAVPIKETGIGKYLDLMVGTSEVKRAKPFPDPLFLACEKLSIKPNEIIYTGDTDIDMKAASAGDILGVGVTTGNFTSKDLTSHGAWKTIDDISEILNIAGIE